MARLKSPVTGLFIGYVGADRFYKGDKNLAINKLSYFIVAIAFTIPGIYITAKVKLLFLLYYTLSFLFGV